MTHGPRPRSAGLAPVPVEAALGAQGLAGYDAATGRYLHRELPFQLDRVEFLQPRLKNARRLLEAGGLQVLSQPGPDAFDVAVSGTTCGCVQPLTAALRRVTQCSKPFASAWIAPNDGIRSVCRRP